jgi:hypothetical protein
MLRLTKEMASRMAHASSVAPTAELELNQRAQREVISAQRPMMTRLFELVVVLGCKWLLLTILHLKL